MQTISLVCSAALVHQSMPILLLQQNYCRVCRSCQICKPYFLAPFSQLPENPCCYSTGQCCSPLRTARAMNRFPALVRSSVEPFFGISNFGQNAKTLLFWAAAAPPLVHQSKLLYYCRVCLPSDSCQICKPFL